MSPSIASCQLPDCHPTNTPPVNVGSKAIRFFVTVNVLFANDHSSTCGPPPGPWSGEECRRQKRIEEMRRNRHAAGKRSRIRQELFLELSDWD